MFLLTHEITINKVADYLSYLRFSIAVWLDSYRCLLLPRDAILRPGDGNLEERKYVSCICAGGLMYLAGKMISFLPLLLALMSPDIIHDNLYMIAF